MSFVDIPVAHGRLEGLLWKVESPRAAAVVCHPHPIQGGTMHNHVTYRLAAAFRESQVSALRFNFRGVGRSSGTYDEGRGEIEDGAAALEFLAREQPGVPLIAAGFSFGSRVALQLAAADARVQRVLAVGIALRIFDFDFVKRIRKPKAFIHADRDEFADLAQVTTFLETIPTPKQLFVVQDSDHLASGRLTEFERVAREAVAWLMSQ